MNQIVIYRAVPACWTPDTKSQLTTYNAPTDSSMPLSLFDSFRLLMPPMGPSLHPPTKSPPIQIAGTEVLPMISAISALMAFPSSSRSSSTTVYLAPFSSKTALAFTQKGQVVKLNISTGVSFTKLLILVWIAAAS